jgi:outer membrane protein OmpA-like peptidoglycan-associated protein
MKMQTLQLYKWFLRAVVTAALLPPAFICNAQKIDSTWMRVRQLANQPMPQVKGKTIEGKVIDSNYFRNQVVLLSFANLINVGSLQQIPFLNRIKGDFIGRPFKILTVIPNSEKDAKDFNAAPPNGEEASNLRTTFKLPVMEYDVMPVCTMPRPVGEPIGVLCDSIVKDYLIGGYPTICLIDKEQIIRFVHVGFAPKPQQEDWLSTIENQISELLGPPSEGERVVLRNILFETNSFALKRESKGELDELVSLLQSNAGMRIQIVGYTDNTGNEASNLTLSQNRARAVYEYLVSQGISPERLSYMGMGESNPAASNDSEEGRAQNRRIEFTVIRQ